MHEWINTREMGPIKLDWLSSAHMQAFVPPHERPVEVMADTEPGEGLVIRFRYLDDDPSSEPSQMESNLGRVKVDLGKKSRRILGIHIPESMRSNLHGSILADSVDSEKEAADFVRPNRTAVKKIINHYLSRLVNEPRQDAIAAGS